MTVRSVGPSGQGRNSVLVALSFIPFLLLAFDSTAQNAAAGARCPEETGLRSLSGTTSTTMTFVNDTTEAVRLFWLDYQGKRIFYSEIPAGRTAVQPTYLTHPWVVANQNGDCLRVYMPTAAPQRIALAEGRPSPAPIASPPTPEGPVGSPKRALAAAQSGTGLYALESEITFNVLDHVEIDRATGKLILMGHKDPGYATGRIPYLQYLAVLLDNPNPEFSFEWTPAAEARVADLRRRLNSDDEWKKLAGEWGRWIDDSEQITPAGRYFMPLFGVSVPAGSHMDRYQVLAGVFRAIREEQAADILAAFGTMYRAMPNPTSEHLFRLFRAAGVFEVFQDARAEMQAGRMTDEQVKARVYRALFASFDQALNFAGSPTSAAFESALRRGQSADGAMGVGLTEFDRQFQGAYGQALRRLYRSKSEIQVPITLVNPSWQGALNVEPKYIGVNSSSLLAKLLLDADRTAKTLINTPELAEKIPGYQTQFAYRMKRGSFRGSDRVSTSRLWISVDSVDASQSTDGNILALGEAKMRFNMRELGQGGRDLPGQQPGEYERLLSSLYDGFARHYSPVFHELREAAKLAYVAQWLKAKNPAYRLPAAGLDTWNGPASVPGVIFITWSPDPSRPDVQAVSAIGGVSLRVPPPGNGVCVKFCEDKIPTSPAIKPVSALPAGSVVDLISSAVKSVERDLIGLYLSMFLNPFELYASAATLPGATTVPRPDVKIPPEKRERAEADTKAKEEEEEACWRFHQSKVGYKKLYEDDNDKSIAKDESILLEGEATRTKPLPPQHKTVCGIVWHFIQNPDKLHCGPDPALKAKFTGGCRPAINPIQLQKGTQFNYGEVGEIALWQRVHLETGKVPGKNWKVRTNLVSEREVDVVGHEDEQLRSHGVQCILHCPGAREILPESMK